MNPAMLTVKNNDQAAHSARCVCDCVRCTQTLGHIMCMSKTDQAARMCSSCCLNTSAQPYRGTHIYVHINEFRWTMRSLNGAYIDRLLDNHVVITDLDARGGKKSPHSQVCSSYKLDYFAQHTQR